MHKPQEYVHTKIGQVAMKVLRKKGKIKPVVVEGKTVGYCGDFLELLLAGWEASILAKQIGIKL